MKNLIAAFLLVFSVSAFAVEPNTSAPAPVESEAEERSNILGYYVGLVGTCAGIAHEVHDGETQRRLTELGEKLIAEYVDVTEKAFIEKGSTASRDDLRFLITLHWNHAVNSVSPRWEELSEEEQFKTVATCRKLSAEGHKLLE